MSEEPVIRIDHVGLRYGESEVLRDVTFDVHRGETVCVIGGSGGGKSSLLKVMIGVVRPTAGRVILDGEALNDHDEKGLERVRRKFGVTFQSGALLNSMTVWENVALPLEYHTDLDPWTIDTMVKIKLHQMDMLHAAHLRPSEISGGMQKRAAIARAMALDPKILFYDEPSAGLDPIATNRLDQLINKLRSTMGITSVVVTHVMESVRRIADRVIMLDRGTVIHDGTVEEMDVSGDPRVQQFRTGELLGPDTGVVSDEQLLTDLLL